MEQPMTSFFSQCPKCSTMIVKGNPCPSCRYSESAEDPEKQQQGQSLVAEYESRRALHTRNYTIFMVLMFATGILGMLTAWMWFEFIFLGSVAAAILLVPLNIGIAVLGYMLKGAKHFFPTEIFCPACNTRLDEIGLNGGCCPGCSVPLR
jgi:hypothetical protein